MVPANGAPTGSPVMAATYMVVGAPFPFAHLVCVFKRAQVYTYRYNI